MNIHIQGANYTPGFSVSIYRDWPGTSNWTSRPTYRYFGMNVLHNRPWWRPTFRAIIDDCGRLYLHLGYLCLFQDIRPFKHRRWEWPARSHA